MGWGERRRPSTDTELRTLLEDLARTGGTLELEADLGATVVEQRFQVALHRARHYMWPDRFGQIPTPPSPVGPAGPQT